MSPLLGANLFEIVPLAASLLAGLGSLIVAIIAFGVGKKEPGRITIEKTATALYRDRLKRWRAHEVISTDDETWTLLMTTGDAHPEVYVHVYRTIKPHVREIKMVKAKRARHISIELSVAKESVAKKDREAKQRNTEEPPDFYVGVPVPL